MNTVTPVAPPGVTTSVFLRPAITKNVYQRSMDREYAQALLDAIPEFQRKFERNKKFEAAKVDIINTREIGGEITIGMLDGKAQPIDGQHRLHAFLDTDLQAVKVTIIEFSNGTYQDYAREFTLRNSSIRALASDDRLRGMAPNLPLIKRLVEDFPWLNFTTAKNKDILSVSIVLAVWNRSNHDTPSGTRAVADIALEINDDEYLRLAAFMQCCQRAWGEPKRDNKVMWGSLTLTMVAWLFRRIVHPKEPSRKITKIDELTFSKCLMALASDPIFSDWVVGRHMGRRDRGPTYNKVKEIFAVRIRYEHPDKYPAGSTVNLPQPKWSRGVDNTRGRA